MTAGATLSGWPSMRVATSSVRSRSSGRPARAWAAAHHVSHYLSELAGLLHSYYAKHQVLLADDMPRTLARLALLRAVAQVLRNGLDVLGVSAPESM